MRNSPILSLSIFLGMSCSWFCLWVISYHFVLDAELAILFFPFALRLGSCLHISRTYWPAVYLSEWLLTISLALLMEQPQWFSVLGASMASYPFLWMIKPHYYGEQWRKLMFMGACILMQTLINILLVDLSYSMLLTVSLVSITGGLMLVPFCYLLRSYLFNTNWAPLTASSISSSTHLRYQHIALYAVLFAASIAVQIGLPSDMRSFAPFCLAIPIVLLAYRYGWQGALIGTLLNSVVLIAARGSISQLEITDLLLSLSAQSLTGIILGVGVQKQRDLNEQLRKELSRNQNLSTQLVKAEESVRREIARELHDEIGQNITAIRTQANIIKRVNNVSASEQCASTIEKLSLNVYDTTKGLLSRLRPKILDDLGIKCALKQLVSDLECEANGIEVSIHLSEDPTSGNKLADLSDTLNITIYRICQESLNNTVKYAQASNVTVNIHLSDKIRIVIADNGIGIDAKDTFQGFGLKGMKERVQALGGTLHIRSCLHNANPQHKHGTKISAELPLI
ncbi:signal transduction histidine-protein kinase/phosphatase UhpB [Vibrio sp. JC009]|uniref:signal transduction histidine-protein kinase/phosphatase UhpB n=1 Tax=Vibrio sp. JC009 TaxID=2912314 RepID=UPI0023B111F2|nr:signal transduction histidine-protein kinase/phosphatase UhpB [Vibrio sp. JC009]WED24957.1 signal transduction histidine-protein kinase/phosphatase UhpB [Vibrio sp. JC009]